MRLVCLLLCLFAASSGAHEFWIEPRDYQPPVDGQMTARLLNGEDFAGSPQPFLPKRFVRFVVAYAGAMVPVKGRVGDVPALNQPPVGEGLHVIAYHGRPLTLGYNDWDKFRKFAKRKDLGDVDRQHAERGLPATGFDEVYIRLAKSLVGVGAGAGHDLRTGLETEFVALSNPYRDDLSGGMRLQLFYGDATRGDAQVEVFEKGPDGAVALKTYRTNGDGIAVIAVRPGFAYMADAVVLRAPSRQLAAETGAVWETLWANLTWFVPGR
ncbi:MAG: DUF4198 domain-containing protein [Pseudomonadota bacterium]